ncbi:hypothetical protein AF70_00035670 [Pseudomonas sp. KD5]|jgi:hypothetical protein|uniref:Uncharacterized protein n=1 Tax=Pseudomonas frederiksbergensis TaxID=104087 RepID=A0AB33E2P5_9PSED|nr:hypothetical protein CNN82_00850 [Pseudomonas frederiksbergensis]NMN77998.1 hypothetical protein [Pseudomonas sp. KD5]GID04875.1 hypothetical protein TMM008_20770 [Pseudomonas sp. 008]
MTRVSLGLALFGLLGSASAGAEVTSFNPVKNVEAMLEVNGPKVKVTVQVDAREPRTIDFAAEKSLHVAIDDFNFDGMKDFSVWQIDDGMGTYTIHRIFIYRPKTADFEEVQPDCGDGFVNLRVDKKRKVLLSTYWGMDGPQSCVTRFHKR